MKRKLVLCGFTFLLVMVSPALWAGDSLSFKVKGNIGLHYDYYTYSAVNYNNFRPRYPEHLLRFSAGAMFQIGSDFSVPFAIDFTNQQGSQFLPNLPEERFIGYVQNPRNNFRISPTWKWLRVDLGTHTPEYSPLSTGDIPLFGVGIEMKPGRFLFSASYGRSQIGVNADPLSQIEGAYSQRMLASRIGVGNEQRSFFYLIFVHMKDDVHSVDSVLLFAKPREGVTLSPLWQLRIAPKLFLKTETAASVHTHNLVAPGTEVQIPGAEVFSNLFTINLSSFADISNISSLEWRSDALTLGGEVRYLGAGFMPAGYRVAENDLIDYNLKTSLKLFKNKLFVNGSGGLRITNLSQTKTSGARRLIANVNFFSQISKNLSVAALYTNFGYRNNVQFDTLRVEMIQQMASVTPAYRIAGTMLNHVFSGGPSLQYFDEWNAATGEKLLTRSESYNLNYNVIFNKMPLSLGLVALYLENETALSDLSIYHIGISARYRFMKRKLTPSVMVSQSGIYINDETPDKRLRMNIKLQYKLLPDLDLEVAWIWSHYAYGSLRPGATTLENRGLISIQKRF